MGKPRHTAEQIIAKLREAEVLQGKGMLLEEVLRQVGISDATYYPRSTQRRKPVVKSDEEALRQEIVATACAYGRYGYRRVTALLRNGGWRVNHKRVERIWRQEGLKVPKRQPKRRRLWLNDGSCIRLRPEYANHVWSYDFVAERTSDGKALRMLNIMDEYTRECLRIHIVEGQLDSPTRPIMYPPGRAKMIPPPGP